MMSLSKYSITSQKRTSTESTFEFLASGHMATASSAFTGVLSGCIYTDIPPAFPSSFAHLSQPPLRFGALKSSSLLGLRAVVCFDLEVFWGIVLVEWRDGWRDGLDIEMPLKVSLLGLCGPRDRIVH